MTTVPYAHRTAPLVAALVRRRRQSNILTKAAFRIGSVVGERHMVGKTLGGSPIALSMLDVHHRHIYFFGEYERETTALFRRLVRPGWTVFDVGANAGYFSVLAAELGATTVRAFEPNPNLTPLLGITASSQTIDFAVVAAACSDREGQMALHLARPGNTGASSLHRQSGVSVDVDLVTLDGFAARHELRPDLIKIDVEGHELKALLGASTLLRTVRPVVVAEVGQNKREEVVEFMKGLGYEPELILEDGATIPFGDKLKQGPENVVFRPPER
jgi:FkbM family methyltransferase